MQAHPPFNGALAPSRSLQESHLCFSHGLPRSAAFSASAFLIVSTFFSGYSAMSDGQCQTHLQELLLLGIPGNHRKPQGTLHPAYFHLKSLDSHSSFSLCPPWSSEPNPGQSDTCQRQTHILTVAPFGRARAVCSPPVSRRPSS